MVPASNKGAGKSTIVMALALGLCASTAVLARQKNLSDFVKRGAKQARIRITLKGQDHDHVISRSFSILDNSSTWKLNGVNATLDQVKDLMLLLNVQVDNLCQFLPQDRVADFAKMDPQNLLLETQRAAGGLDMLHAHQQLIELGRFFRDLKSVKDDEEGQIKVLKEKNEMVERDVQRWRQRQEILKLNVLLETALICKQFEDGMCEKGVSEWRMSASRAKRDVLSISRVNLFHLTSKKDRRSYI